MEGPVSLALFEDYAENSQIYIQEYHEKVSPTAIVPKIMGGIKCRAIRNAYFLEQAVYDLMTLDGFLNAMHSFFFNADWAMDQAQKVKSMKQDGLSLKTWFVNVFSAR